MKNPVFLKIEFLEMFFFTSVNSIDKIILYVANKNNKMKENKTTTINPFKKEFFSKDNRLFGGVIENFENASTLKFWTKDFWKKDNLKEVGKGIGKTAVILGAMIIVGVLLGPIGWGTALIGSVAMGAITPKIASACGSKGMEKSSEHRQEDRLNNLTVKKIQEKKERLEKTARKKRNFGIGAIVVGILITVLTGGIALPLLCGGIVIGGIALYSSSKDTKLAEDLDISSKEMITVTQAAIQAGIVKQEDLQKNDIDPNKIKSVVKFSTTDDNLLNVLRKNTKNSEEQQDKNEPNNKQEVKVQENNDVKIEVAQANNNNRNHEAEDINKDLQDIMKVCKKKIEEGPNKQDLEQSRQLKQDKGKQKNQRQ